MSSRTENNFESITNYISQAWKQVWILDDKVEPLRTDTSPLRTVSNVPKKFSFNIFFKKNLYKTDSL